MFKYIYLMKGVYFPEKKKKYLKELSRIKDRLGKPVTIWMVGPGHMIKSLNAVKANTFFILAKYNSDY